MHKTTNDVTGILLNKDTTGQEKVSKLSAYVVVSERDGVGYTR